MKCFITSCLILLAGTAAAEGQTYGGHVYSVTETEGTWQDAENQAVALGGHLVTINDAAENSWLFSTFESELNEDIYLWMGLYQISGSVDPIRVGYG